VLVCRAILVSQKVTKIDILVSTEIRAVENLIQRDSFFTAILGQVLSILVGQQPPSRFGHPGGGGGTVGRGTALIYFHVIFVTKFIVSYKQILLPWEPVTPILPH
jgi:hypothetical protein